MTIPISLAALAAAVALPVAASAQHQGHMPPQDTTPAPTPAPAPAPHDHHQPSPTMAMPMPEPAAHGGGHHAPAGDANATAASGTALLPAADGDGHAGVHLASGDWRVMLHGHLWAAVTDQGGPRGDDMAFVQSMGMVSATRPLGEAARLELRTMFSLEPAMGARGYPNLLASGETAGGVPLVDRQHPHDLFMELAARIEADIAPATTAFLYGGPVGEPALGPAAFMHRRSARYQTMSPIGHHWFDSTHITYGVVTAGIRSRSLQIEASAFRGREPDEERWGIETPRLDSWSARLTLTPSPNWTMQVSHGRIESPETLHGGADERRTTASVHYARDGLSLTAAWAVKQRVPGTALAAWLGEANWDIDTRHSVFARGELVSNDELFPDHAHPLHDQRFRVGRIEGGYAYRIPLARSLGLALGGSVATYALPDALSPYYGSAPVSVTGFAKLTLGG
jgi:hypothetical protein